MTATNPKIGGPPWRWADFRGMTVLFTDPAPQFHRALDAVIAELAPESVDDRYLRLPVETFHVTAWDGVNVGNLHRVTQSERQAWGDALQRLPEPIEGSLLREVREASLLDPRLSVSAAMVVDELQLWGGRSIVATLRPSDTRDAAALDVISERRRELSASFQQRFAVSPVPDFRPHITVGYLAAAGGSPIGDRVGQWTEAVRSALTGYTHPIGRAAVFGFTDMVTFLPMQ